MSTKDFQKLAAEIRQRDPFARFRMALDHHFPRGDILPNYESAAITVCCLALSGQSAEHLLAHRPPRQHHTKTVAFDNLLEDYWLSFQNEFKDDRRKRGEPEHAAENLGRMNGENFWLGLTWVMQSLIVTDAGIQGIRLPLVLTSRHSPEATEQIFLERVTSAFIARYGRLENRPQPRRIEIQPSVA